MADQFPVSEATEGQAGTSALGVDTHQRSRTCAARNSNFSVSFLLYINDLGTVCPTVNYVDNSSILEAVRDGLSW